MRKQNALIAGAVVIASVLALAQSANAQYYRPGPGGYVGRPMPPVGYPRPMYGAPAVLPYAYPAPAVLPPYPQPYYNSYAGPRPQQPQNQGAQWNTTSNGWPQFPTLSQDVQAVQQAWPVIQGFCGLFC
jgi:hypothetical protein